MEAGAVQCGFCTPGLIMATVDLLEHTPSPTDDEVREALSGQPLPLYGLPEDLRRGEGGGGMTEIEVATETVTETAHVVESTTDTVIGTAHAAARPDAPPKVLGEFAYSSDLNAAGMLWGHTLRSPHSHARILEIDISRAVDDARRPRRPHARRRHGPQDVRARVPRPARARVRARPLLRGAASPSSRPSTPSRRAARPRRSSSSTSRSSPWSTPSARRSRSLFIPTAPPWATATARIRVRTCCARC